MYLWWAKEIHQSLQGLFCVFNFGVVEFTYTFPLSTANGKKK